MRFPACPQSAQTAYAELFAQTQAFELGNALAGLVGAFHKRTLKGRQYWYFAYRDMDQKGRMAYVGPDNERVRALVLRFEQTKQEKPLAPPARMAIAAGCTPAAPKHFRIIKRLAEYGFFRAGGILIGTHAFLALGNMLGVRWRDGAATWMWTLRIRPERLGCPAGRLEDRCAWRLGITGNGVAADFAVQRPGGRAIPEPPLTRNCGWIS